ncbi:MAG TPA: hypothetical protein DDZ81_18200 [Acetobacteraceae bacterium]|jgi:uncharacterized protein|nr:hypothetical protein [Acetobacteraceae bacterium]
MRRPALLLGCGLLAACAAPALTLYTLGTPPVVSGAVPLGRTPVVISLTRVSLQDDLDTQDIVVRDGSMLQRSHKGRWAARLSMGITDRLTQRLAARYPGALVTDRPLTETPTDRILVNIGRLDVTTAGIATLDADWLVVPRDTASPTVRNRANFSATGPVGTDQDVVTLIGMLLDKLADVIEVPGAH